MKFVHKFRHLKISVVSASLLLVLWLSTTMWINALKQHELVHEFELADTQEEALFEIADALAAERRQMYIAFSTNVVDSSVIEQLRSLSNKTEALVVENEAILASMQAADTQWRSSGYEHQPVRKFNNHVHEVEKSKPEGLLGPVTDSDVSQSASEVPAEHVDSESHAESRHVSESSSTSVSRIINKLRKSDANTYRQLLLNGSERPAAYGMNIFHEYSLAIGSVDGLRHTLHTSSRQTLPEHYMITKLKNTFWDFRESVAQISTLLEGITVMTPTSVGKMQTHHHADMLLELKIRIDTYWQLLNKTISISGDELMIEHAISADNWYEQDFRVKSLDYTGSAQYDDALMNALQVWLESAHRLSSLSEDIRAQSRAMTVELIHDVEQRTIINLIQVSILVLFSLVMVVASLLFLQRVDRQAHQDELTGLDNRRMFSLRASKCLASSQATDAELGILMIDLDRFKFVNDTMGHAIGDRLLNEVANRIRDAGKLCHSISRLGGDEFALLFDGENTSMMESVANDIRQKLIDPFCIDGASLKIGSSIGLAKYPRDADTLDSLIQAADLAMYCAKKSGTNQISEYDSHVDQSIAVAARTVSELQLALQNNEFELHYQPQFNLAQAKVLSAEALIRWNHPERGLLSPYHFITIAEENGLMSAIGDWVIDEACRQAAFWLHVKKIPLRVAVNISADHFFQDNFVKKIKDCLHAHNLPAQFLEVEVTESVAMSDIKMVVDSLQQLRDLSIHVALDDFGTGYSSLSYLQELPLDTLKIDKSFIQNMLQGNAQKESITQTIVALGELLNLETVAEGVETIAQLAAVSDMKISVVQGYYYSKPVTANEVEVVVRQLNSLGSDQKAA